MHDYRQLLDAVDAVTVAVPTFLHREVAGAFLARGIATMVEKPMAGTLAEAEQLAAMARVNGAVLQVGHIERFNPALLALNQLPIRPKYITAERLSTYTFRSTDIGVVFDLMIHDLDLLLSMIAAPVRSVAAVGLSLFGEHEDVANARIEFEDGSVANLTASRASYTAVRKMRIWGAEGYASLDFAAKQATLVRPSEQLRRGRLDLDGVDLSQPAAIKDHLFGKVLRVDQVQCESAEPLALELEDFVAAARGDRTSPRRRRGCPARHPPGRPGPAQPRKPPVGRRSRGGRGASPSDRGRHGSPGSPCLADQEPAACFQHFRPLRRSPSAVARRCRGEPRSESSQPWPG